MESKFLLNSLVKKKEEEENTDLVLTGIASTTREPSLYGEVMSTEALNMMCEQAVGLPILEGHQGDSFDTVIGVILDAYILEDDLHIDFKILSNHQERITELLNNDVPIGLSIGAQALIDEATKTVTSISLIEVSLTPVPANRAAHNTVHVKNDFYTGTCLHGICNAMIKDNIMEVTNMVKEEDVNQEKKIDEKPEEEKEDKEDTVLTVDKVKEMIDERFNEEREGLIDTIVEEVIGKLNKADTKLEESLTPEKEEEAVDKVEDEVEVEVVKESAPPVVDEDKIVESITEKILDSLGEKRDVSNTLTETALKEAHAKEPEVEVEDKPFTSEEAAKLIINDMNKRDPLARAINTIIKE